MWLSHINLNKSEELQCRKSAILTRTLFAIFSPFEILAIVLDDMQYLMSFEAMDRAKEKSYEKFTEMAQHMYSVFKEAMNMRDYLMFVVCTHSENAGDEMNPNYKIKTIGQYLACITPNSGNPQRVMSVGIPSQAA